MIFIAWYDDWIFLQDATELRWYNRADVMYQVCRIKFHGLVIVLPQKFQHLSVLTILYMYCIIIILFCGEKKSSARFSRYVNQYFILFLAYRP